MKYYKYSDFNEDHVYSEEDILKEYYPAWKVGMERLGRADEISKKKCIEDWCITHWAELATEEEYVA